MIACALFEPFPFWQACWDKPELRDKALISLSKGKVEAASVAAKKQGIKPGMSLAGAMAYADVEMIEANNSQLKHQWDGLLDKLYSFTNRLESAKLGLVFLDLDINAAKQIASFFSCRVAVASSKERAHLLALTAFEGIARIPEHEEQFLARLPLWYLRGIGLKEKTLERFKWLGLERLGQLLAWRKSQTEAFLGLENKTLLRYMYGPFDKQVADYKPAEKILLSQSFDEALTEPYLIEPYLRLLAWESVAVLAGKSARYITLTTKGNGLSFSETKRAKYSLNDARTIFRHAQTLLYQTGAFGIEELKLELSGLYRMSEQGELWQQRENLEKAVREVEERFPEALLKFRESNPHALISEHRYELIRLATGEAVYEAQHHCEEQLTRAA